VRRVADKRAAELLAASKNFLAHRAEIFPCVRGAHNCAALQRLEDAIEAMEGESGRNPNISPSGPGRGLPIAVSPVATRAKYSAGREGRAR
jgi:hypothetical protein